MEETYSFHKSNDKKSLEFQADKNTKMHIAHVYVYTAHSMSSSSPSKVILNLYFP